MWYMSRPTHPEAVSWHHTEGAAPLDLPIVVGELARTASARSRPVSLLISGWLEGQDSAVDAVSKLEAAGWPAVGAWFSYCDLPPAQANLLKSAIDAPLTLAREVGQGRPVNLVTHSLGDLTVMAVAEDGSLFRAVGSDSPHVLACQDWARLPLLGSREILRPLGAAARLGRTCWSLRQYRSHPAAQRMLAQGQTEVRRFGRHLWPTASFAASNKIVNRTAGSYVQATKEGHPVLFTLGSKDTLVPPAPVRRTLSRAALEAGLDADHFEPMIVEVPHARHTPWWLPEGRSKLDPLINWLEQLEQVGRRPRRTRP
jgi:hypothetical protein